MVVAIALAVNLTCRAAGPVLESFKDRPTDRSALRHLTLAIHRVVRRWMRRDVRPGGETTRGPAPSRERHRRVIGPANQVLGAAGLRLPAHLIDMPPPLAA
ncbi:MAG: hypothetical protein GIKADHBN_00886 [Phycisphaerales bacterium]|nr:hypothetical protein [Phycisphaerales bacterium]